MHVNALTRPLAFAVALTVAALGAHATVRPRAVAELRITNHSPYDFDVAVSNDRREWVLLAIAAKGETTIVEDVADQGTRWHFRLRTQGVAAAVITVPRAQLQASRWTFDIPTRVAVALENRGVPLPP